MKTEVSVGEAIDKLSILEIKLAKIADERKRTEIQKEIEALSECLQYKKDYDFYYNILMYINEKIWTMTDDIKQMTPTDPLFAHIANQIFEFNQKRFRLKTWFNLLTSSAIKEQKSYATSHCQIVIDNEETFLEKVPEIHFLAIEYDVITFTGAYLPSPVDGLKIIPSIIYDDLQKKPLPLTKSVRLSEISIPSEVPRTVFEYAPLNYLVSGMFGDFIQTLSVICEVYHKIGRKGILYISENKEDRFLNGVENTYKDTYPVIMNQPYIKDYQIFNNKIHNINCNLSLWRLNTKLFYQNWYHTFNQMYGVEWGKRKWLNVGYDEKWKNKVVINTNNRRFANTIDFYRLKTMYHDDLIFIASKKSEHEHFEKTANISIEYHEFKSFLELTTIISSCKLFVGCLSAPLAIAHALHKPRICGFHNCDDSNADYRMNVGLDAYLPNLRYEI
jgi:hypothetical protein